MIFNLIFSIIEIVMTHNRANLAHKFTDKTREYKEK